MWLIVLCLKYVITEEIVRITNNKEGFVLPDQSI